MPKRKYWSDKSYRPGGEGKASNSNRSVVHMLTDANPNIKTSFYIKGEKSPSPSETALIKTKSSTYSPIKKIIVKSKNDSPLVVETKTEKLSCVARPNCSLRLFSSDPNLLPVDQIQINPKIELEDFYCSQQYKKIKAITDKIKIQQAIVSPEILKQAKKKPRISQNKIMTEKGETEKNGSAKKYASVLFSENIKMQWLHLVAKMFNGEQSEENLVAGTDNANIEMLLLEEELKKTSKDLSRN